MENQLVNQKFPKDDQLKEITLGWSSNVNSTIKLDTRPWYTNDKYGHDEVMVVKMELAINGSSF